MKTTLPDNPATSFNEWAMHIHDFTEYKGFQINKHFKIFKNSKPIFTAYWQHCRTLEEAKLTIDGSLNFQQRPDMQASLKKLTTSCELENGTQGRERFEGEMNDYFDNQLNEQL